ncbi:MAG: IS200/IS605 family transposase [Candidatus Hydrogenedentes bacterium]|nr:IS200/IS605 family transposase [Candidatus Hydrogenedentota bacterium]
MPQSFSCLLVHATWSTKDRRPILSDSDLRVRMHEYLGGASNTLGCQPVIVGGVEDHVHVLAHIARTISVSDWIKEIKRVSSIWVKDIDKSKDKFQWQAGYGVFSVSFSSMDKVKNYIAGQEEHHKKQTFQDELRQLLRKHEIEWDERYIWD